MGVWKKEMKKHKCTTCGKIVGEHKFETDGKKFCCYKCAKAYMIKMGYIVKPKTDWDHYENSDCFMKG